MNQSNSVDHMLNRNSKEANDFFMILELCLLHIPKNFLACLYCLQSFPRFYAITNYFKFTLVGSHAVKKGLWYLLKKRGDVNQLVIFDMLLL